MWGCINFNRLSENDEKYFFVYNLFIFSYVFFRVGHKSKLKQTTLGKFQSWKDGQIEMNDHTIQILKSGPYFNKSEVQEKISNLCCLVLVMSTCILQVNPIINNFMTRY